VWIDDQRVGTGVRKFGAVLGDGVQVGCNAVTNPGCVLAPGSTVDPNTTVNGVHLDARRHR
jgi:UDP-3-O-[3-hydroxymyristoyl] glucosamine N-acyltransferase